MDAHLPIEPSTKPRLAERLHRLKGRWRNGGVEDYRLDVSSDRQRKSWVRRGLQIEVTKHRVRLDLLPETFSGLRIVQLTDIHHGLYFPADDLQEAIHVANELEPEIIALTGDYVTLSASYIEPVAEMLEGLKARRGVYAVLGNHDFRVGAELIVRALRRSGVEVLRNRHVTFRHRGDSLYLAGIDDLNYKADLTRAVRGIPAHAATILLSHNPRIIHRAARAGVGLVLSGHTHGGQVRLPLVGSIYGRSPAKLRFKEGWDRLGGTRIYVSRGIGTVILPLRYGCSAEIPAFTLEPSAGGRRPNTAREGLHSQS